MPRSGITARQAAGGRGNLVRLLADDPIAAYWVGFLMADATFNEIRIRLRLAIKDHDHLEEFASYLGENAAVRRSRSREYSEVGVQDRSMVPLIRERFDLLGAKTYNPPRRLPYEDRELLKCWLVGMIDGDGNIKKQTGRKSSAVSIVAHSSWEEFYFRVRDHLGMGVTGEKHNSSKRYITFNLLRHNQISELKVLALRHGLPILTRKWDRVDIGHVVRGGTAVEIRRLLSEGVKQVEIARVLNTSESHVSNTKRRMKKNSDNLFHQ